MWKRGGETGVVKGQEMHKTLKKKKPAGSFFLGPLGGGGADEKGVRSSVPLSGCAGSSLSSAWLPVWGGTMDSRFLKSHWGGAGKQAGPQAGDLGRAAG